MKTAQVLAVTIGCLLSLFASGKHVTGYGYMVNNKLNNMAKFSFRPGSSEVIGNITYEKEPRGKLYFFIDTNWDEMREEQYCESMRVASTAIEVGKVGEHINVGVGQATGYEPVRVEEEERELYTWRFKWKIRHEVRTYGWYFVAAHCEFHEDGRQKGGAGSFHKRFLRDRITYTLDLFNPGQDHLPADEHWLDKIYLVTVIIMCAAGYVFRKNSPGKRHLVVKLLSYAYVCQVVSMVLEIIHLTLYSYNGYGSFVCDFFSDLIEGVSQLIITYVLLFIANGWTVIQPEKQPGKFEEPSIGQTMNNPLLLDADSPVLLFIVLTVFATTILQILNKVFDRDFQKFHDYETYAGFFLILLRAVYAMFFMYAFQHTISRMKRSSHRAIGVMRRLQIAGSLWFWSYPLLYVIAGFFAHYLRHFVVTAGVLLTQTCCLLSLAYQFISTKSTFSKYSSVSAGDVLPGFSASTSKYF